MMRALFSSVSALRNHQLKLDILGNNIANINTVGYKGGRVTFSEALTQILSGSSNTANGGFTNPMSVGLGMSMGSVDTQFSQGSFEATGNTTDLAIEGEGFFVVSDGGRKYFTRAGAFHFNAEGKLVTAEGYHLQGRMINLAGTGTNQGTSLLGDVVLDPQLTSPAQATQNLMFSGNLNAGLTPVAEVWSLGSTLTTKATITGSIPTVPLTITGDVNDKFTIVVNGGPDAPVSAEIALSAGTYGDVDALVDEINTQISSNADLDGIVEVVNQGGALKFRGLGTSASQNLTLNSVTDNSGLSALGFSNGDTATAGGTATESTLINDLLQVSSNLVSGDTLAISGTGSSGDAVSGTFTFGVDGMDLGSLVTVMNAAFPDSTTRISDGNIQLTDNVAGESSTTISLSAGSENVGAITLPSFNNTTAGFTGTVSTSAVIYDSLGGSHTLILEFTKTENDGEWAWTASGSGDEEIIDGGSGKASFDTEGNLSWFTYDDGADALSLNTGNGAAAMSVALDVDGDESTSGLTQFDSVSTLLADRKDGRAAGSLVGVNIGANGSVIGAFTNGENITVAHIVLANFNNPGGLAKVGNGLYETSGGSGDPAYTGAGDLMSSRIASGALEMSNVDLAKEFTEMITAQRGFQANARLISTADQILEEVVRLKR